MPYFSVYATDKKDHANVRAENRSDHIAWLGDHGHPVKIAMGGPTLDAASEGVVGSLLVVEAETLDQARAFCADDPYAKAGLFDSTEVRPFKWGLNPPAGD